ncbi:MAG: AAA family ATPase [Candidatus Parvarchaeota archaeon]
MENEENKLLNNSNVNIPKNTARKVKNLYDYINSNFLITNKSDNDIGNTYNSALLLPILTNIVGGKQLVFGNPGNGKTTSIELISSLIYSVPMDAVISLAELHGHPEMTSEDIFGSLDLPGMKKMNWSPFVQFPYVRIIDEINRLNGKQQDALLNIVDRGIAKYLKHTLIAEKSALFATANYADMGNTEIIPPLADRFDVSTEIKQLNPLERILLALEDDDNKRVIEDANISDKMAEVLDSDAPYSSKLEELKKISNGYYMKLKKDNPDLEDILITHEDLDSTRNYINQIPLSDESKIYIAFVHSELAVPGIERIGPWEDKTGHYANTEYAFNKINRDVSNRFTQSWIKYSKAYCWFFGNDVVEPSDLQAILPYAIAHRVEFRNLKDDGNALSRLSSAKIVAREINDRYNINPELYKSAYEDFVTALKSKNPSDAFNKTKYQMISDSPFILALTEYLQTIKGQ